MPTGAYDSNGIWQYGESDPIALFSDLLNLGQESTSDAFTDDRARIAFLEQSVEQASTFVASSAAARDSYWGVPTTGATQLALQNKGARTVRTDLGITEQYFAVYNVSTNPGGMDVAGWYRVPKTTGLVPLRPTAVDFVTGTGDVNALGQITAANCSQVSIRGIFTEEYKNYRIIVFGLAGGNVNLDFRFLAGTTPNASANYAYTGTSSNNTAVSIFANGSNTQFPILNSNVYDGVGSAVIALSNPASAFFTNIHVDSGSNNGQVQARSLRGYHSLSAAYDGIALFATTGNFWSRFQVFGYND